MASFTAGLSRDSCRLDAEEQGILDELLAPPRVPGLVDFIQAGEPRLLAFNEYTNAERTEVTVVQVHPDAASMEAHMEIVRERAQAAYADTLDATVRIQVFGQPTEAILETLRQQAGSGVEIRVNGEHLGGFTRSAAQR